MKRFTTILYWFLCLDIIFMLLGPLFWLFDLWVHFAVQFGIVALICVALLIRQKRYRLTLPLILAVIYFSWPFIISWKVGMAPSRGSMPEGILISIFQVNASYFNDDHERLIQAILKEDSTVIAISEATTVWRTALRESLSAEYPYIAEAPLEGYEGMMNLSKIPFDHSQHVRFDDETPPLLETTISEYNLTLMNIHTLSPVSGSWSKKRDAYLSFIADHVRKTEGTVIVAGDFNTTVHSRPFKKMLRSADLTSSRRGWKPTWMVGTPLAAAIDHILYRGDNIQAVDFKVLPSIGSDHRPIMSTFIVSQ